MVDVDVNGVAALPDGVHFVVGLGAANHQHCGEVRLYHVDGTLVHTFKGHTDDGARAGGDARRPAHHQRRERFAHQGVERRHKEPREHLRSHRLR